MTVFERVELLEKLRRLYLGSKGRTLRIQLGNTYNSFRAAHKLMTRRESAELKAARDYQDVLKDEQEQRAKREVARKLIDKARSQR